VDNKLFVSFPETPCVKLTLEITRYYSHSPAIRELEIWGPNDEGE